MAKKMKVNKTETRVLNEMLESGYPFMCESGVSINTWEGKWRPYNVRELKACIGLVTKGLAAVLLAEPYRANAGNGKRAHGHALRIELTEKGREYAR